MRCTLRFVNDSAQSTETNAARLDILKARDNVLKESLEDTEGKLKELSENSAAYSELVSDLILQGLLVLKDDKVVVRCRRADIETVDSVLEAVSEKYLGKVNSPVEITTDKSAYLGDSCAGGVVLLSQGGSIMVDNTFESRLEIAYSQNLPEIRKILFGSA